jgi:hypothetical protein
MPISFSVEINMISDTIYCLFFPAFGYINNLGNYSINLTN